MRLKPLGTWLDDSKPGMSDTVVHDDFTEKAAPNLAFDVKTL